MKSLSILKMLISESLSSGEIQRVPEPNAEMNNMENIKAFHTQGNDSLIPVYHFNAMAMSHLVKQGGTVVDLGSGTGQYLVYLARYRPDLTIIGVELAENMVAVGTEFIKEQGVSERVKLIQGDMTSFSSVIPNEINLVSSVFSLHHLPESRDLISTIKQMEIVRNHFGSALWVFDHARPKHNSTPEIFPEIFTPDAHSEFKTDSRNSLIAAYSYHELSKAFNEVNVKGVIHECSKWMKLYQIHWLTNAQKQIFAGEEEKLRSVLAGKAKREFQSLKGLFNHLPE